MMYRIMDILPITDNRHLVADFLKQPLSPHFRYFETRGLDALQNHIYTIVGLVENVPVAYGHLDFEDKVWLGICVAEPYRRKGYGTQIFQALLDYFYSKTFHTSLYLTVDADNSIAIQMYKKAGFQQKGDVWCLERGVSLPVSFGEAFDKLSILEIKLQKIQDPSRRSYVQEEHRLLTEKLQFYMSETVYFHFAILRQINTMIWVLQDKFRDSSDAKEKSFLCERIILENDRRFRVKHKIDSVLHSSIKEQKGYTKKKALVLPHQGLGDLITNIGLIRYYSTVYDEVHVITSHLSNASLFFADDPSIYSIPFKTIFPGINPEDVQPTDLEQINSILDTKKEDYTILPLGLYKFGNSFDPYNIPFCFYETVGVHCQVFWDYFHIPTPPASQSLYTQLQTHGIKEYVFVHNQTSKGESFDTTLAEDVFPIDKNTLILNPNKNIYEESHPWHQLAQSFVGKPLAEYKDTIIHANHILLTGSSFFCLALNLEIQTDSCYIVEFNTNYNYIYDEEYVHSPFHKRTRFKNFIDYFNCNLPLKWYIRHAYSTIHQLKNMTILECGSHQQGDETREFRQDNDCYYIEANPDDYEIMRKQTDVKEDHVFNYALSDVCGTMQFTVSSWPGNSSLAHSQAHLEELNSYGASLKTIEVSCITYAHLINEIIKKPIDFLVLDIEGYECKVLESMASLPIDQLPLIICIEAGYDWLHRKAILERMGYTIDFYVGNNVVVSRPSESIIKRIEGIRDINRRNPKFVWQGKLIYENDAKYK